jgi:penicillin-binding protein 1A
MQGRPATPFNVPSGMQTAWINPNSGVQAYEGESAIAEAFKPGTGPNLSTSVIGLDVAAFDQIQREQMMQQQYGAGYMTQPSGNGLFPGF